MEEKGWTITYIPWEDMEGKPRVAGRFKTTKEKDDFLESLYERDNGWLEEELATLSIINDYIVNELYLCVLHPNLIEYTAATKSQNADTKCVYYIFLLWKVIAEIAEFILVNALNCRLLHQHCRSVHSLYI